MGTTGRKKTHELMLELTLEYGLKKKKVLYLTYDSEMICVGEMRSVSDCMGRGPGGGCSMCIEICTSNLTVYNFTV